MNEVTEWLHDPAGRLSQRKLGNGTWEEVSYDARSRVTGIALKKPGATLRQHTYGYNAVSNVTSHSVGGMTTTYGYDLADQLISESRLGYAASYTYDANGSRATRTVNGVTETHVSDAADKPIVPATVALWRPLVGHESLVLLWWASGRWPPQCDCGGKGKERERSAR